MKIKIDESQMRHCTFFRFPDVQNRLVNDILASEVALFLMKEVMNQCMDTYSSPKQFHVYVTEKLNKEVFNKVHKSQTALRMPDQKGRGPSSPTF